MPSYARSDRVGQQFVKPSSFKAFQNKETTLLVLVTVSGIETDFVSTLWKLQPFSPYPLSSLAYAEFAYLRTRHPSKSFLKKTML